MLARGCDLSAATLATRTFIWVLSRLQGAFTSCRCPSWWRLELMLMPCGALSRCRIVATPSYALCLALSWRRGVLAFMLGRIGLQRRCLEHTLTPGLRHTQRPLPVRRYMTCPRTHAYLVRLLLRLFPLLRRGQRLRVYNTNRCQCSKYVPYAT